MLMINANVCPSNWLCKHDGGCSDAMRCLSVGVGILSLVRRKSRGVLQDRFSKWQFLVYGFLGLLLLEFAFIYQFVIPLTPGRVGRASFTLIEGWGVWRGLAMMLPPVPTEPLGVLFLLLVLLLLGWGGMERPFIWVGNKQIPVCWPSSLAPAWF